MHACCQLKVELLLCSLNRLKCKGPVAAAAPYKRAGNHLQLQQRLFWDSSQSLSALPGNTSKVQQVMLRSAL